MDIEKLKKLVEEGKYYDEIAFELNCTKGTVQKYCKDLGLIAKTKIVRRNDPEMVQKVEDLFNQGKTNQQIADVLGICVTTVRRYITKLLGKESNSVKKKGIKEVKLTQEQWEIIYGGLLGDMNISKTEKLARLAINQGGIHEAYFDHLCSKFSGLLGKINKTPRYDKRTKKYYNKFCVRFLAHQIYLDLYNKIYPNGVKTISQEWIDQITWRSIAYWFMDDGAERGLFATNSFTLEGVQMLQKMFLDKFNIRTRIRLMTNEIDQWLLVVCNEDLKTFEEHVKPYMIPEMYYKLVKIK